MSKSIIKPQTVTPVDLEMPEYHLVKRSMSPRQVGVHPHPSIGVYSLLYSSTAAPLSGIVDCLLSGNPMLLALSMRGEVFIDQITGDIYTYDQTSKLLISTGDIDKNTTVDLQQFLKDKDKNG